MNNTLTIDNLMHVLPTPLKNDAGMNALGQTAAMALIGLNEATALPIIYARIDALPGWLLDVLAADFKVDWYAMDADEATKRAFIKDCFYVHRHRGTRAAMTRGIKDVMPDAHVQEWFEYGGDPYTFRVVLRGLYADDTAQMVLRVIRQVKNCRSALSALVYEDEQRTNQLFYGVALHSTETASLHVPASQPAPDNYLVDESGDMLLDGAGRVLYE